MKRLYSIKGQEADECYPLEYFREILKDGFGEGILENTKSLDLEVWEPKTGTGTFWCSYHGEGFESGEGVCGELECGQYEPRNGKSGRCRWHTTPHHPTGKTITITK